MKREWHKETDLEREYEAERKLNFKGENKERKNRKRRRSKKELKREKQKIKGKGKSEKVRLSCRNLIKRLTNGFKRGIEEDSVDGRRKVRVIEMKKGNER